jgi:hypothetical protein
VSLDPALLEILRCPDEHHAALTYDEPGQTLTCTECGRVFEIREGIPVLLLEESEGRVPTKTRQAPEDEERGGA